MQASKMIRNLLIFSMICVVSNALSILCPKDLDCKKVEPKCCRSGDLTPGSPLSCGCRKCANGKIADTNYAKR